MVHTLLLKNGTVCTLGSENPEIIENGAILVEDDTIAQVGIETYLYSLQILHFPLVAIA